LKALTFFIFGMQAHLQNLHSLYCALLSMCLTCRPVVLFGIMNTRLNTIGYYFRSSWNIRFKVAGAFLAPVTLTSIFELDLKMRLHSLPKINSCILFARGLSWTERHKNLVQLWSYERMVAPSGERNYLVIIEM